MSMRAFSFATRDLAYAPFLLAVAFLSGDFLFAQEKAPGAADGSTKTKPIQTVIVNGQTEPVYQITKGIRAPRPLDNPSPEYSEEARRQNLEGVVVLDVIVTSAGNVETIRVTRGAGHGLDEKAIQAVRRWTFKPATKDGKPVSVEIAVETDFHLVQRDAKDHPW
jgi:TonB family protein